MTIEPTAADIDNWSSRLDAKSHLPTLVRRLILASSHPTGLRMPAAEGIALPGFDGKLEVAAAGSPFVPIGRSVWELGAGEAPASKAASDYSKRTSEIPPGIRATTTFVFVTSRKWPGAAEWARAKAEGGDGWADVRAIDAEDLATWFSTCPGVRTWFEAEHLGRPIAGAVPARDWFVEWSEKSEPAIPSELLLAGRRAVAEDVIALSTTPGESPLLARTVDEAVAFAASCFLTPGEPGTSLVEDPSIAVGADVSDAVVDGSAPLPSAEREAILERVFVVLDEVTWRALVTHESALVLVPVFAEPPVDLAVRHGHRVVLPMAATAGQPGLPPLDREGARKAWTSAGIDDHTADELARASRRSLASLRRRIGRTGRFRHPGWSDGANANLLAALLLAGRWRDDRDGDREVVLALTERATWRSIERDLTALLDGDGPLLERGHEWQFLDPIDAWDCLSAHIGGEVLSVFVGQAMAVLSESDPTLSLDSTELRTKTFAGDDSIHRRHSGALRTGIAGTIALLGSLDEERVFPGGRTGQAVANEVVRQLLYDADAEGWQSLADVLPVLAEAAPSQFLAAVQRSLTLDAAPVMSLFVEKPDALGLSSTSRHTSLLWSLETLAFSPEHAPQVARVLAALSSADPGGRLANRPAASLADMLHLVFPQGAVDQADRLAVIDGLRASHPAQAWSLMLALAHGTDGGIAVRNGPRFRDWEGVPPEPTYRDVWSALNELAGRLVHDADSDGERWIQALHLIDRMPPQGRDALLLGVDAAWEALDLDHRRQALAELSERVNRHARFRDAAWAMSDDDLRDLQEFLDAHELAGESPDDALLFAHWPRLPGLDPSSLEGQSALQQRRAEVVQRRIPQGFGELLRFAESTEAPELVGEALARATSALDDTVLELLTAEGAAGRMAAGLVGARAVTDPDWLRERLETHSDQAVRLCLAAGWSGGLPDLIEGLPLEQREEFWSVVPIWRVPQGSVVLAIERLLEAGRPFSAAQLLQHSYQPDELPVDLTVRVLRAPRSHCREELSSVSSPEYVIGELLDRLERAGVDAAIQVELAWFYLPVLHHQRGSVALFQQLATDPEFFAEVVSFVYRPDKASPDEADPADAEEVAQTDGDPEGRAQLASAAWNLLRDWRLPLPGVAMVDGAPSPEAVQAWVDGARGALDTRARGRIGSVVIGEALSGPAFDEDGTWPCRAVRDVVEHEADDELESGLLIGRVNQRGVTTRSPYDGGDQERQLAARYRDWAHAVRSQWPRSGAMLDSIAEQYEAEGRRHDDDAARNADL